MTEAEWLACDDPMVMLAQASVPILKDERCCYSSTLACIVWGLIYPQEL